MASSGKAKKGRTMKKKMTAILVITGLALALFASSAATDGEKVITGDGACAKCILKETKDCQITITADEGGKKVTYYLAQNDVSKQFGKKVCDAPKRVVATGTVKTVDGKHELTPTKIELAKE
jgi:hypothetical protein